MSVQVNNRIKNLQALALSALASLISGSDVLAATGKSSRLQAEVQQNCLRFRDLYGQTAPFYIGIVFYQGDCPEAVLFQEGKAEPVLRISEFDEPSIAELVEKLQELRIKFDRQNPKSHKYVQNPYFLDSGCKQDSLLPNQQFPALVNCYQVPAIIPDAIDDVAEFSSHNPPFLNEDQQQRFRQFFQDTGGCQPYGADLVRAIRQPSTARSNAAVLKFLVELCGLPDPDKWTGWRILLLNGVCDVSSLQISVYARHFGSQAKLKSGA